MEFQRDGRRPTGEVTQIVGWLFLGVCVALLFAGWASGTEAYGLGYLGGANTNPAPSASPVGGFARSTQQKLWFAAAGGAFSMFLVFWSVGTIVHAISFLPGGDLRARRPSSHVSADD